LGVYDKRPDAPLTPRMLLLSMVVGTAPALNNLSLSLNNLGFYQVVKLLVTPAIVGLEAYIYGARMSIPRSIALLLICVGVGFACVNDVDVDPEGALVAFLWLPVAAVYKVLWSRISKEEKWHTLALMRRIMPFSTVFMIALVPIIDPPGLLEFSWTPHRFAMVMLSGVAAFFVNWSGFMVMGCCSALAHTVLGQLKACGIILGGWFFFAQSYPPKAIAGAALAIVSMCCYTKFNLAEQEERKKTTPAGEMAPVAAAVEAVDDGELLADESGDQMKALLDR